MVKTSIAKRFSKKIEESSTKIFRKVYSLGFKANYLTLIQLPLIVLMIWFAYNKSLWKVITLSLIMIIIDAFDGPFARVTESISKLGHLLDKIVDLLSITSLAFSIGIIFPTLMKLSIVLIITTIILYLLNEKMKTEVWGDLELSFQ